MGLAEDWPGRVNIPRLRTVLFKQTNSEFLNLCVTLFELCQTSLSITNSRSNTPLIQYNNPVSLTLVI